ncbi:hypothetical protein [Bacillus sp. B1-b2]|nr:hypothetical protein [Bacillus sp. B1-b2]
MPEGLPFGASSFVFSLMAVFRLDSIRAGQLGNAMNMDLKLLIRRLNN